MTEPRTEAQRIADLLPRAATGNPLIQIALIGAFFVAVGAVLAIALLLKAAPSDLALGVPLAVAFAGAIGWWLRSSGVLTPTVAAVDEAGRVELLLGHGLARRTAGMFGTGVKRFWRSEVLLGFLIVAGVVVVQVVVMVVAGEAGALGIGLAFGAGLAAVGFLLLRVVHQVRTRHLTLVEGAVVMPLFALQIAHGASPDSLGQAMPADALTQDMSDDDAEAIAAYAAAAMFLRKTLV